jgi:hypothetical protein
LTRKVYFEALINLRPGKRNMSMTIEDPEIRRRVEQIARDLLEAE